MKKEFEKVELKKVLCGEVEKDITVEIVPFNRRNDDHVDFALATSDMLGRLPSDFHSMSDAARRCAELFIVHTEAQANDPTSDYSYILNDKRACRLLFNTASIQKALADFFTLA